MRAVEAEDVAVPSPVVQGEPPLVASFDELYQRYRQSLVHHLFNMVGRLDRAVELSHEAFLRAHRERQLWKDDKARPVAWLFRVAGNLARNDLRQRARQAAAVPPPVDDRQPIDPYEVLVKRQTSEQLRRAMADLPPRWREVLSLRYYAGLSCRQIAETLSMTERTVMSDCYRARQALKRRLT